MNQEHGGNLDQFCRIAERTANEIVDFSVNVNPAGMPEFMRAAIYCRMERIDAYPEPYAKSAVEAAADFHNLSPDRIVFGNGTNQLIHILPSALGFRRAVICTPAFSEYEKACSLSNVKSEFAPGKETDNFFPDFDAVESLAEHGTAAFVANPGNPAGTAVDGHTIIEAAKRQADCVFIVDEAFAEYAPQGTSVLGSEDLPDNLVVLRSLTKFYGMAGLRAGYAVASAQNTQKIRDFLPQWSLNSFAIGVAVEAFRNGDDFRDKTRSENDQRRAALTKMLSDINGIKVFPSQANYLLLRIRKNREKLFETLLKRYGIAIRECSNFRGLESGEFFRVAVRGERENEHLAGALRAVLSGTGQSVRINLRKRKPSLMLQGTSSSAGKSILTAAFCRILLQDGYRVAPFKSQNMALNSYVTLDGGEIGRAQAVQAEACRIEPDPRMNPLLLKPSSDTDSQVIAMGKVVNNMNVPEYFRYKEDVFGMVTDAYNSLEKEYDVIVLEGAGSPGEVNLKSGDIVNMRMAQYAESPVLLVGDIDRGGVYAAFVGTMNTFDRWERELTAGFIVNRFRGDQSLLGSAHDYVQAFTGRPVLGVIPYLHDIGIPEEDMTTIPFDNLAGKEQPCLDAAVVVLHHVSNFTDFAPLAIEPDVNVRLVRTAGDFGTPDIVIIPGSKNVIGDLGALHEAGLAAKILESARQGAWIVGMCGGLQICGKEIEDPHNIESPISAAAGLGLIDLHTRLEANKTLVRAEEVTGPFGMTVSGYEIHHGQTRAGDTVQKTMTRTDGTAVGFAHGKIWTTYLHGIFDEDNFRRRFIDMVREDRGLKPVGIVRAVYNTENALNRLADVVRENLDMEYIYKQMKLK